MSSDPDILSDFILPQNSTINTTTGQFFTFSGMRPIFHQRPQDFTIAKASLTQFPALEAELLFLARGSLKVGFVDTANKLYTQTLQLGDMFVFPKGLVHFQYNVGKVTAVAFSAFGSANAGTVSLPPTLFASGIDDDVLVKGFKSDVETIQSLKAGLSAKK
ncbi:Germin-like protein 9-3 [Linum perenne]